MNLSELIQQLSDEVEEYREYRERLMQNVPVSAAAAVRQRSCVEDADRNLCRMEQNLEDAAEWYFERPTHAGFSGVHPEGRS